MILLKSIPGAFYEVRWTVGLDRGSWSWDILSKYCGSDI